MVEIDFSSAATQQLHRVLVDTYAREERLTEIAVKAGVPQGDIPWKSTVRLTWMFLLMDLENAQRVEALLDVVLADPSGAKAHGEVKAFRAKQIAVPARPAAPVDDAPPGDDERKSLEKVMGDQPTFLDIAFLQGGLDAARAVARLRMRFAAGWYLGTGFLIGPQLVLTNHHNLFDGNGTVVSELEVQFDYEATPSGAMREVTPGVPVLDSIQGERDADWAIVRLAQPVPGRAPLRLSSHAVAKDAWVAIIQHPNGLPKKIALHHNTVTYADADYVLYLTDTLGGSSGSPVFDETWEVVALHHAGGDLPVPGTTMTVYRNRGIPIARVKARLDARNISLG